MVGDAVGLAVGAAVGVALGVLVGVAVGTAVVSHGSHPIYKGQKHNQPSKMFAVKNAELDVALKDGCAVGVSSRGSSQSMYNGQTQNVNEPPLLCLISFLGIASVLKLGRSERA